jgi:hypothetical protein
VANRTDRKSRIITQSTKYQAMICFMSLMSPMSSIHLLEGKCELLFMSYFSSREVRYAEVPAMSASVTVMLRASKLTSLCLCYSMTVADVFAE